MQSLMITTRQRMLVQFSITKVLKGLCRCVTTTPHSLSVDPSLFFSSGSNMVATYEKGQYHKISSYDPPEWAKGLKGIPRSRAKLSMSPTPIHKWTPPGLPDGFEVSIKREDLSGSTLSGNKVRKLDFLLADAIEKGCDTVITMGGFQSNHARATAVAARELGLEPYVFILDFSNSLKDSIDPGFHGNTLLMRLVGAHFVVFPFNNERSSADQEAHVHKEMDKFAEKLSAKGHNACIIPGGGSNTLGAWGWIDCFHEMMEQGVCENFDDVFMAAGSIGSLCGLAIGNYLTGSKLKIHGVSIDTTDPTYLYSHVEECLTDMGLTGVRAEDLINPVLDYVGNGYGNSREEELETIVEVISKTGVTLDPDFTVKSFLGMVGEMKRNPLCLKGKRVLFIHTGGVYVLFDGRVDHVMQRVPVCNRVTLSKDLF